MPTRGNNTNNYAEAAMRVLKDKILQRTKAFNLPQLFDLLTSRLEAYYDARLTDVALGRSEVFRRFLPQESNIEPSDIRQVNNHYLFSVSCFLAFLVFLVFHLIFSP